MRIISEILYPIHKGVISGDGLDQKGGSMKGDGFLIQFK